MDKRCFLPKSYTHNMFTLNQTNYQRRTSACVQNSYKTKYLFACINNYVKCVHVNAGQISIILKKDGRKIKINFIVSVENLSTRKWRGKGLFHV